MKYQPCIFCSDTTRRPNTGIWSANERQESHGNPVRQLRRLKSNKIITGPWYRRQEARKILDLNTFQEPRKKSPHSCKPLRYKSSLLPPARRVQKVNPETAYVHAGTRTEPLRLRNSLSLIPLDARIEENAPKRRSLSLSSNPNPETPTPKMQTPDRKLPLCTYVHMYICIYVRVYSCVYIYIFPHMSYMCMYMYV